MTRSRERSSKLHTDQATVAERDQKGGAEPPTQLPPARFRRAAGLTAFGTTFALVLVYSLRGGAYGVVAFEEYGLVIWWLLAIAIATGLLPRARPHRLVLILWAAMLGYTAWTALSLMWTQSSELTTVEIARSLDYLGVLVLLGLSLDRDTWRAAAAGLGCGALAVCVLALASRIVPAAFPADVIASTFKTDRLTYPFGYWNAVAAWGAMSTTLALAWSAHDRNRLRRAAVLATIPITAAVTYLSYSRAGVIGSALGVAAVLVASRHRVTVLAHTGIGAAAAAVVIVGLRAAPEIAHATGDRGAATVLLALACAIIVCVVGALLTASARIDERRLPRRMSRELAAVVATVALVAAVVVGPALVSKAWRSFTHQTVAAYTADSSTRLFNLSGNRFGIWNSALGAFSAHPLDGTGAGTFEFWWNTHSGGSLLFLRTAHSLWLQNMGELGLPGLLLILVVAIASIAVAVAARRQARRASSVGLSTALLVAFVVYLLHASVDWMWESTAVSVLAFAAVAILGARLSRQGSALRWWPRAAFVALALGAGVIQIPGSLSTIEIGRSQAAERAGNGDLALTWANDAIDVEPWSASAYEQRGLVLEAAGRYGPAAAALRTAISYEPTNYVHWLDLARVETESGQIRAALADYARARSLRPESVAFTR